MQDLRSPMQEIINPTQEIISPTQEITKSYLGLNKSYVGDNKSYVGDNKSYGVDNFFSLIQFGPSTLPYITPSLFDWNMTTKKFIRCNCGEQKRSDFTSLTDEVATVVLVCSACTLLSSEPCFLPGCINLNKVYFFKYVIYPSADLQCNLNPRHHGGYQVLLCTMYEMICSIIGPVATPMENKDR